MKKVALETCIKVTKIWKAKKKKSERVDTKLPEMIVMNDFSFLTLKFLALYLNEGSSPFLTTASEDILRNIVC